jgi:hypothetical protein
MSGTHLIKIEEAVSADMQVLRLGRRLCVWILATNNGLQNFLRFLNVLGPQELPEFKFCALDLRKGNKKPREVFPGFFV